MENNDINVQLRLSSISEVSFMMSPGKIDDNTDPENVQIGFSSQIQPDINNNVFTLNFGVRYEMNGEAVLESIYRFTFAVKDLKQFVVFNDDQNITVNHIMPHFLSVAVGTMRGILVAKTAGTVFSKYPLPMIDINILNSYLSGQK